MSKDNSEKVLRDFIRESVQDMFVMDRAQNVTRLSRDSVDDQIDSMILKFEKESILDPDDELLESIFETKSLKTLIHEQEDDEEDDEEEVDEPAGSEDVEVDEPAEAVLKPRLNVDTFSKKVARLALNSRNLLDPATAVINRAINFLSKNYDQAHVDRMVDVLNTQFDFNLGKERDENDRAVAVGAFGGNEGGAAPAGN
jgi:hypothetical protein